MKINTKAITLANGPKVLSLSNSMALEDVAVNTVRAPERQPKPPSKRAITTAKGILQQWGAVAPIIIGDDGTILAGLEFLMAAKDLGWATIKAVRVSSLTKNDQRVLTIALTRLPELSHWDADTLSLELEELSIEYTDGDLNDLTGFSMGEWDAILDPQDDRERRNPLDDIPDVSSSENTVTRSGDRWCLELHRIACGDALNASTYDQLMGEKTVKMLFTDPPYNISIANNVSGLGKVKHENFAMGVGEMSFAQFSTILKTVLANSAAHLMDGGLLYVFMDRRHLEELLAAARELGLTLVDLCFWNKLSGGMGSFYRSQHEPCAIFKYGTAPSLNNIELGKHGRYRTNVWDHRGLSSFGKGRDEALKAHPTVKPVNLLAEAIKDCTKRGEIILDPFLGSGSTIIAAEKVGRVGYGIELEPRYVDVAIQRWEKMTGKPAVHEATGLTFAQMRAERLEQVAEAPSTSATDAASLRLAPTQG